MEKSNAVDLVNCQGHVKFNKVSFDYSSFKGKMNLTKKIEKEEEEDDEEESNK